MFNKEIQTIISIWYITSTQQYNMVMSANNENDSAWMCALSLHQSLRFKTYILLHISAAGWHNKLCGGNYIL